MKKYPEICITLIHNMIKFHFDYEDIYEQIQINFPNLEITFDEMLDIIIQQVIDMI